jgi:S1-C subfamily serine protease
MADGFDPYREWLSIPPEEQPPHHYRLLDLRLFEDLPSVIRAAAAHRTEHLRTYQLSKHSAECQDLLNQVAAASACLLNLDKKAAYDANLRDELEAKGALRKRRGPGPSLQGQVESAAPNAATEGAKLLPEWAMRMAIALGATALFALMAALFALGSGGSEEAVLVFDWPEDRRPGAELVINGDSVVVPASGPCEHRGEPGTYEIVATRPGFEPFARTIDAEPGKTTVRPVWQPDQEASAEAASPARTQSDEPPDEAASPLAPKVADASQRRPEPELELGRESESKPGPEGGADPPSPRSVAEATERPETRPTSPLPKASDSPPSPRGSEDDLADAIARARASVVRVFPVGGASPASPGAGFVLGEDGVVVTSFRAIKGATGATASFADGTSTTVQGYVAVDKHKDIALLRVVPRPSAAPLSLARRRPMPNEQVAAVGPSGATSRSSGTAARGRSTGGTGTPVTGTSGTGTTVGVLPGEQLRRLLAGIRGISPEIRTALDPAAAWIQTTARISQENAGGPLINSRGDVVGVSTWFGSDIHNAGFALAAEEVRRLLVGAGNDSRPLASLWQAKEVVLSPGFVFRRRDFEIDLDAAESLVAAWASEDNSVLQVKHGSLFQTAYVRRSDDRLDGLAIVFHDEETPMLYVNYDESKMDGLLKLWDAEGRDRYWCEYVEGERNGFCCAFEENQLSMVSEVKADEYATIVLFSEGIEIKRFRSEAQARQDERGRKALEKATDIEDDVKTVQLALVNKLRSEIRAAERAKQQPMISRRAVQARANIAARANQRRAESGAAIRALRRSTGLSVD